MDVMPTRDLVSRAQRSMSSVDRLAGMHNVAALRMMRCRPGIVTEEAVSATGWEAHSRSRRSRISGAPRSFF
jgi:hypothetical protein